VHLSAILSNNPFSFLFASSLSFQYATCALSFSLSQSLLHILTYNVVLLSNTLPNKMHIYLQPDSLYCLHINTAYWYKAAFPSPHWNVIYIFSQLSLQPHWSCFHSIKQVQYNSGLLYRAMAQSPPTPHLTRCFLLPFTVAIKD
jgi:hypothetical protein